MLTLKTRVGVQHDVNTFKLWMFSSEPSVGNQGSTTLHLMLKYRKGPATADQYKAGTQGTTLDGGLGPASLSFTDVNRHSCAMEISKARQEYNAHFPSAAQRGYMRKESH